MTEEKPNNDGDKKKISTSDMTRRMVCGGLAGMVAKVRESVMSWGCRKRSDFE